MLRQRFIIPALLVSLTLALPQYRAVAGDWPVGRGDAQGTAATDDQLPQKLDLLWTVELDGLGFDAGPIIAGGNVFANDHDGRLISLDLKTGKRNWQREFDAGFVAPPAFSNGTLFAADFDGILHALNATDGSDKWQVDTGMEITASPVFYRPENTPVEEASVLFTSQNGSLYRLRVSDGKEVWKYETEQPILCGATLAGEITFLGGCDEQLHLVDIATGKRIGDPIEIGPTQSTPNAVNDSVLIPTQGGDIFHFKIDAAKPGISTAWTFHDDNVSDEFRGSLAVSQGLAVGTGRNKKVFAIDIETGKVKWTQRLRKRADASPVIAGDSAIIAAADGRIIRYDLQSGEEQWLFEVKGTFLGSPAVADGKLVLANDRGTIFCFGEK